MRAVAVNAVPPGDAGKGRPPRTGSVRALTRGALGTVRGGSGRGNGTGSGRARIIGMVTVDPDVAIPRIVPVPL